MGAPAWVGSQQRRRCSAQPCWLLLAACQSILCRRMGTAAACMCHYGHARWQVSACCPCRADQNIRSWLCLPLSPPPLPDKWQVANSLLVREQVQLGGSQPGLGRENTCQRHPRSQTIGSNHTRAGRPRVEAGLTMQPSKPGNALVNTVQCEGASSGLPCNRGGPGAGQTGQFGTQLCQRDAATRHVPLSAEHASDQAGLVTVSSGEQESQATSALGPGIPAYATLFVSNQTVCRFAGEREE